MDHFYQSIGEDWFTYPNLYKTMVQGAREESHFVEVGSWKGRSATYMAVEIINSGKNIKLDCIDTWEGSVEHVDMEEIVNKSLYNIFLKNIEPVKNIINPIKKPSIDAAKAYPDNSLDFIFIDASHEYNDVKKDINAWISKLKNGAVLAGHDWHIAGVREAVNEVICQAIPIAENCWYYTKTK